MGLSTLSQSAEQKLALKHLGIVVAMDAEARCLTKRRIPTGQPVRLQEGILIQISGIGAKRAYQAARTLLEKGARALLSWGTAGGLVSELSPGCLILPKTVLGADRSVYHVDSVWHECLLTRLNEWMDIYTEALAESAFVLTSSVERRILSSKTGAIAVDMESAAVAAAALEADVPFIVIRAVSDPIDRVFPSSALTAIDPSGQTSLLKLIRGLVKHPAEARGLVRLERDFRAAQTTLATVVRLAGINFGVPK